jgi:hypothetical protein|tara:strand:- start:415 stop:1158 length:744 start_codon:yes stop_codon:yes gene_type:complete
MASTYTANSGIEKPGSGEQSGTWGTTTNTNFDIIDRVLNGVGTITLSGTTHTLTTSDGSLSDGHYKVLILAGSPSGTNTVTISPNDQDKLYLVNNTTSQSVTFTQGSGGNITIVAGAAAWIYADGAGSGAQVRQLPSDVVGDTSPQLGGNLDLNSNNITGTGNINTTGTLTVSGAVSSGAISTGSANITSTGTVQGGQFTLDNSSDDWTFTVSSNKLIISYSGTAKMELDTSGNLKVTGNVTAYGTI